MNAEVRKYFNRFTKDELSTILSYFDQTAPKNAKKVELVDLVSDFIGGHPREWLYYLPERDLRMMLSLCNAGPETWIPVDSPEYPSVASVLGLIYVDDDSFDDVMATMDYALYPVVASIISQVIQEKEDDGSFRIERMVLGLLNTYGAISIEDFVEIIFAMYDDHEEGQVLIETMAGCPLTAINRMYYKEGIYLVSPYAFDYEDILDGREQFKEIQEYPLYSEEEIVNAGASSPFCAFRNDEYDAVRDILEEFDYTDEEIRYEIHKIWLNAQYASNDASAEAIFSCINSRMDDIESFDTYRHYIDIVAAYANSVPKWLLKGSTSDDVGLLQLSIKVDDPVIDTDGQEDTSEKEEELGPLKEFYKYNMAVRHVAPDDPCPCGSGLSYCRCHGRRLN